jgi:hypothetical protein
VTATDCDEGHRIADALATITPALITPGRGRPPAAVLRTALYGHAFNPARASTDPGPSAAALAWARDHSLPVTALADAAVTRRALEAWPCGRMGAGQRPRPSPASGLSSTTASATRPNSECWRPNRWTASPGGPRPACPVNPRAAASPAEAQAILAEITKVRPELTAFFGCLYYAALRPAEAVALCADSWDLLPVGWGQLTLTGSLPRLARAWTGNGTPREARGLKLRPGGLVAGVLIGAPWVLLGLAGISLPSGPESYPELAVVAAIAPLAARWAGYGLLFGYFFPLLRGSTGLGKAVCFSAVASAPAVCAAVAGPDTTARRWDSTALLIIELVAFAMTLGLLADRAVLLKHDLPTRRLVDLHNLWTISAWASSVAVAVAAGVAAVIIAGLQPFVIGVINPSSPAPHPAASPTATSGGSASPALAKLVAGTEPHPAAPSPATKS